MIFSFFKNRRIGQLKIRRAYVDTWITQYENLPQGIGLTHKGIEHMAKMRAEFAQIDEELQQLDNVSKTSASILIDSIRRKAKVVP